MAENPGFFVWTSGAELADAVLTSRKALGMTQVELGRRAGVGRKFVWHLEHGKATLRADKILAVLRALSLAPIILPGAVFAAPG